MTKTEFIEKAIDGGFDYSYLKPNLYISDEKDILPDNLLENFSDIVLNPLSWKAVNKVEKWEETTTSNPPRYMIEMHRMVNALCEGLTIEQFLETL